MHKSKICSGSRHTRIANLEKKIFYSAHAAVRRTITSWQFFFLMNFGQLFDIFMIMFWQLSFQLANQNVSRSERERQIRTPPLLGLQFWLLDYYSIDSSGQILKRTRCLVSHTARWHQTVVRSSCVSTPPSSIVVFTMVLACRPGSLLPCSISQMTTRLAECFGSL